MVKGTLLLRLPVRSDRTFEVHSLNPRDEGEEVEVHEAGKEAQACYESQ
jgi:hypothetical protein